MPWTRGWVAQDEASQDLEEGPVVKSPVSRPPGEDSGRRGDEGEVLVRVADGAWEEGV